LIGSDIKKPLEDIPTVMRAVVMKGHGGFDKLEYHTDWPTPVPGKGEVLVKVHACGLNNTDINTRIGWYSKSASEQKSGTDSGNDDDEAWGGAPLAFPRIQGADVVGTVVANGPQSDPGLLGKRVLINTWFRDWNDPLNPEKCTYLGSECDGGFADFTKVDQRNIHPINSELSDAELATFATAYHTAENMLNRANVGESDIVLIPGASGGVGSALIQMANRRGAVTIAMCSESKQDEVKAIGADAVMARSPKNLSAEIRSAIGRDTVTVVADVVGGALWPELIDVLARGGRYTCAGAIAGPIVELDLRTFYLNDLTFTGATTCPPGIFDDLISYIEKGEIRPILAKTFPLRELIEAQKLFLAKQHVGNIVVTM
jgi:NADPH:quinone reductase-like Zn-dependent oxidoreductase